MKKAVYPGTFDPISNGHIDVIKRASLLFDEVHVLLSINNKKKPFFSIEERKNMIEKCCKDLKNVKVAVSQTLVVNYAKANHIKTIVRGLRNFQDYENEFSLYQFNRNIDENIETILLFPSSKNSFVSSSAIKELLSYNSDVSKYVPQEILLDIMNKFSKNSSN